MPEISSAGLITIQLLKTISGIFMTIQTLSLSLLIAIGLLTSYTQDLAYCADGHLDPAKFLQQKPLSNTPEKQEPTLTVSYAPGQASPVYMHLGAAIPSLLQVDTFIAINSSPPTL